MNRSFGLGPSVLKLCGLGLRTKGRTEASAQRAANFMRGEAG